MHTEGLARVHEYPEIGPKQVELHFESTEIFPSSQVSNPTINPSPQIGEQVDLSEEVPP